MKLNTRAETDAIPAELLPKLCGFFDEPSEFVGKSSTIAKMFNL